MNNPVRAHEHCEWRSAGYCHYPCAIVWKTGIFIDIRTKDAKEFHPQKNMSLCSFVLINFPFVYTGGRNTIACPTSRLMILLRHKYIKTYFFSFIFCFLCSSVLINYHSVYAADAIQLRTYVRRKPARDFYLALNNADVYATSLAE